MAEEKESVITILLNQFPIKMVYVEGKPEQGMSNFYIGMYQVTQALWCNAGFENQSEFEGDSLPMENVRWYDCNNFISKLNELTKKQFRLPTKVEWEYAARGGNKSCGYKYSGNNNIFDVAWYEDNSNGRTHEVGSKAANELGIFDMSGNVWEWCSDLYSDGSAPNENRIICGGCWRSPEEACSVPNKDDDYQAASEYDNSTGFRMALSE
jgi:formylglycine-generating enzyme required for sulfatase activity